jgi:hypothetical protein
MAKNTNSKPTYEAPVAIPLGDLAKVHGTGTCNSGPTAQGSCHYGTSAEASCHNGGAATPASCHNGSKATSQCKSGSTVG